jgi:hypothetical protein
MRRPGQPLLTAQHTINLTNYPRDQKSQATSEGKSTVDGVTAMEPPRRNGLNIPGNYRS